MEHVFPVTLDDFFFFLRRKYNAFKAVKLSDYANAYFNNICYFFFTKIVTFTDTTYPPTKFAKTHPRLMVFMTAAVLII